jgi:C_GCAxxG_C_C family probable redox protein
MKGGRGTVDKVNKALANFNEGSGFNCAQSVIEVFGPDLGLNSDLSLKVAGVFGGGIGKSGETCGAVTGALMVLGLVYGVTDMDDRDAMQDATSMAKKFMDQFSSAHGSVKCKELLGLDISTDEGLEQIKERKLAVKLCSGYISDAVRILENLL